MEISKHEYDSIIQSMNDNELTVFIDTAGFRQLFSEVNGRRLSEEISEPVVLQVAIIKALPFVEFICLLVSSIFLGLAFHAYAIIGIPLILVLWVFFKGIASIGKQRIMPTTLALIVILAFALIATELQIWIRAFIASIGILQFSTCFLYYYTARLAFDLIERSHCFFNMFYLEPRSVIVPLIWIVPPRHESISESIDSENID